MNEPVTAPTRTATAALRPTQPTRSLVSILFAEVALAGCFLSSGGTADTIVKNPGNEVQVANTNENWSVGDFIGLDNDGNNLYDLADYAIGPFRLLSAEREGDDLRVTWMTVGGRTNRVQASAVVMGSYSNVGSAVVIPGVGVVTTNFLDQGAAREPAVFYRISSR